MYKIRYEENTSLSSLNSVTLDIIRIIAAWFVLLGHCFGAFNMTVFKEQRYFFYLQNFAVIIFFSLAGFLMLYSLKNNVKFASWKKYISHQVKRIYRVYVPALILVLFIDGIHICIYPDNYRYIHAFNVPTFLGNLLMIQNLELPEKIQVFGSARPLWTMAVEWWYYIFFSYLYFFYKQKKWKKLHNIFIVIIMFFVFIKYLYNGLAVSFLLGMIMCLIWRKNILYKKTWWGVFSILFLLLIIICGSIYKEAYIFPIFILVPLLIWSLLEWGKNKEFKFRWRYYIRKYSQSTFALYLIHYPIMELFRSMDLKNEIKFCAIVCISNVIAILLSCLFENNTNNMLRIKKTES